MVPRISEGHELLTDCAGRGGQVPLTVARPWSRSLDRPQGGLGSLRLLAGPRRGGPEPWAEHCDRLGGPIGTEIRRRSPLSFIEDVRQAGLTGRGGGAFPTATKLAALARAGRRTAVIANGTETEPASAKDSVLLRLRPHLILDGLEAAARVVQASALAVVVPTELERRILVSALAERSGPSALDVTEVVVASRAFVAGEETSVVNWLDGRAATPRLQPPRLSARGWGNLPTLVQNVETLAHLGLVARFGPRWFRTAGTGAEPGTMLVTVSGAAERTGVYEVPLGVPLGAILAAAAGDPSARFALIGGYSGAWLRLPEAASAPMSRAGLRPHAGTPGAGVVHLLEPGACGLAEGHLVVEWMARQSAGQCGPCVHGLYAIAKTMGTLARPGCSGPNDLELISRWCGQVEGRGACRHPDGVVNFVRSTLRTFGEEVDRHLRGRCSATGSGALPLARGQFSRALP